MVREERPEGKGAKEKIAEALGTGGLSLVRSAEGTASPQPLTEEVIREQSGFKIVVEFPRWQTDGAALASYHDEHERLAREYGWENVIGSTFQKVDTGELSLGLFMRESSLPTHSPRE